MSGDEYTPLHWIPDLGGAQAEENLARLAYFQRTREERLGETGAEPDEKTDGDTCAYCGTDQGPLAVTGHATVDQSSGPSLEVPYYGCTDCIRDRGLTPPDPARGHGCNG